MKRGGGRGGGGIVGYKHRDKEKVSVAFKIETNPEGHLGHECQTCNMYAFTT